MNITHRFRIGNYPAQYHLDLNDQRYLDEIYDEWPKLFDILKNQGIKFSLYTKGNADTFEELYRVGVHSSAVLVTEVWIDIDDSNEAFMFRMSSDLAFEKVFD